MEIYEVEKQKLEIYQFQLNEERMRRIRQEQAEKIAFLSLNGIDKNYCETVWGVDELELLQLARKVEDSHTIYTLDERFYCFGENSSFAASATFEQQSAFKEQYIENGLADYKRKAFHFPLFYDKPLGNYVFLNPIQRNNLQASNVAYLNPLMGSICMEQGQIEEAMQFKDWESTLSCFDLVSHTTLNERQCLDFLASGFFDYETLSRKIHLHRHLLPYVKK